MQTNRQQLNRIFASWLLAGFWLLALIGMSAVTMPYSTSSVDRLVADPVSSETLVASLVDQTSGS